VTYHSTGIETCATALYDDGALNPNSIAFGLGLPQSGSNVLMLKTSDGGVIAAAPTAAGGHAALPTVGAQSDR